jgi:hypothetical protein
MRDEVDDSKATGNVKAVFNEARVNIALTKEARALRASRQK